METVTNPFIFERHVVSMANVLNSLFSGLGKSLFKATFLLFSQTYSAPMNLVWTNILLTNITGQHFSSLFYRERRLDYQPLSGKGAHALSSRGGQTRHERPDTRERRKSSLCSQRSFDTPPRDFTVLISSKVSCRGELRSKAGWRHSNDS